MQDNSTGGAGTKISPYWAKGQLYKTTYQYSFVPGAKYYNELNQVFTPTSEQIEKGFLHVSGGYWYKTTTTLTGIKLIQANIKEIEARIAADQADLNGLREAEKLLNDNPAWSALLDLHNRGLL